MTKAEYPGENGKNEKKKLFLWHKNRKRSFRSRLRNMIKKIKWEVTFPFSLFKITKTRIQKFSILSLTDGHMLCESFYTGEGGTVAGRHSNCNWPNIGELLKMERVFR